MKRVFKSSDFAHTDMNTNQSCIFPKLQRVQSGHREINSFQIKQAIIFIIAICCTTATYSQHCAFTDVVIQKKNNREILSFTAQKNVNVQHYRVEATNDNEHFHVITTIAPKANTIRPIKYDMDLAGQNYSYYRVAKVEMNGNMPYSDVVNIQAILPGTDKEYRKSPVIINNTPIATR
ncbi:MAG: hypothetical protein H6550_00855 [Chitinophagales bacterium]|nr:hypothetical protein [Chitinophagales bacterium]